MDTTKTDANVDDWSINDALIRLRHWASDRMHEMPPPGPEEHAIGAEDGCWLRLHDPKQRISRKHLILTCAHGKWIVRDHSKNGFKLDGVRTTEGVLEPGTELGIADTLLIAESARLASLRAFLGRILGWKTGQNLAVDLALRAVRMAAARRTALVLCGEDDLMSVARSLHRRFHDPDRPFVVCDPRRKPSDENIRSAQNFDEGVAALAAAARGMLCVWSQRLPPDFAQVREMLAAPDTRVHLLVCSKDVEGAKAFGAEPITIPRLATRKDEIPRIVAEYALDATAELGLAQAAFTRADHDWVVKHEASTLPEIERATARLVALRHTGGNVAQAAALLGMARMSLYKWISRRSLPIVIRNEEG